MSGDKHTDGTTECPIEFWENYKIGQIGDNGKKIIATIARCNSYVVYVTEDGKACFEAQGCIMNAKKKEIEQFDKANMRIFNLLPLPFRRRPAVQLGYALAGCFAYDDDSGLQLLKNVDNCVDDRLIEICRFVYLGTAVVAFIFIATVLFGLNYFGLAAPIMKTGIFGAIGALLSVVQRIGEIRSDGYISYFYIGLQSLIRISVGCVFGVLAMYLIEANILFGFLSSTKHGISLAALIAGINERLVPDTLRSMKV
jgi:hypothetical protein